MPRTSAHPCLCPPGIIRTDKWLRMTPTGLPPKYVPVERLELPILSCPELPRKTGPGGLKFSAVFVGQLLSQSMSVVTFFFVLVARYSRQDAGSVKGAPLSGAPSGNP